MVYKRLPQRLPANQIPALTDALLTGRRQVLEASAGVPWGSPTDCALRSLVAAIDALAAMLKHLSGEIWDMDSELSAALRAPDRRNRPNALANPFLLLGDLRALRTALRTAQDGVAVGGPVYQAIEMVTAATTMVAALLSGDPDYWIDCASSPNDGQHYSLTVKRARERGDT